MTRQQNTPTCEYHETAAECREWPDSCETDTDPCCLRYIEHYLVDHEHGCPARVALLDSLILNADARVACEYHTAPGLCDHRCLTLADRMADPTSTAAVYVLTANTVVRAL